MLLLLYLECDINLAPENHSLKQTWMTAKKISK